jgi:cytidylate kinase
MAVITISREFGSEGNYIGTKVAESLGYQFVFKKEIGEIFKRYGMVNFEEVYQAKVNFWTRFDELRNEMMAFLSEIIRAVAHQGNVVIVGRCSYAILRGLQDVFHVRIQASLPIRVARIMQENLTTPDQVEQLVKQEDQNRAKLLQLFYNMPWDTTSAFDLVLDTGKISPDLAVKWIVEAVKCLEESTTSTEPTTKTLEVTPLLSQIISEVF